MIPINSLGKETIDNADCDYVDYLNNLNSLGKDGDSSKNSDILASTKYLESPLGSSSSPKIELCKNCGYEIKKKKGQWFHRIHGGFAERLFSRKLHFHCYEGVNSCNCNNPEPRGNL